MKRKKQKKKGVQSLLLLFKEIIQDFESKFLFRIILVMRQDYGDWLLGFLQKQHQLHLKYSKLDHLFKIRIRMVY